MDKKGEQHPVGKERERKRVFRLKASTPSVRKIATDPSNDASRIREDSGFDAAAATAGASGGGGSSSNVEAAGQKPGALPPPPPPPRPTQSTSDLLLSMEQQLRAGITPKLPTSADQRADLLAGSLLPNGTGGGERSGAPALGSSAVSSSKASPHVSSFVVPAPPSLTRKKRGRTPPAAVMGKGAVGGGGGAAGAGVGSFYVVKEWAFVEKKKKNGPVPVEKPPFFWELWMMMAAFGDNRGKVACKCVDARGEKMCPCIEGVAAMEGMVKAQGLRLVEVCREWAAGAKQLRVKHLQMAMPGEMREYLAWKKAHEKRGTKDEAERGAARLGGEGGEGAADRLRMEGVEESDSLSSSDDDEGGEEDEGNDGDEDGAGEGVAPKPANGGQGGAASVGAGVGAAAAGAGSGNGTGNGSGKGDKNPWQKKIKRRKRGERPQREDQQGEDEGGGDGGESREWVAEEEEVAIRMEHRKRFADERTASMEEDEYLNTFFEFRKAFFVSGRGGARSRGEGRQTGGGQTKKKGKGKKSFPGCKAFLASYIGLEPGCREAGDKKLLEALAFMMYDHVGRIVEAAIRKRTGGRLVCGAPDDPMLSAEEIRAAGATLPVLSGRRQRESVRASRVANPDGISRGRPLAGFPVGLERRGRPLRWPRNTIQEGRVLVEGGEVVDTGDESLAAEAMALLESDFADF